MSASGTAVTLYVGNEKDAPVSMEKEDHKKRDSDPTPGSQPAASTPASKTVKPDARTVPTPASGAHEHSQGFQAIPSCTLCHIPYSENSIPFPTSLIKCSTCRKARVPDVLFMTIEPPPNLQITGTGCLIQARVCRSKRDSKGECCAKEISDVSTAQPVVDANVAHNLFAYSLSLFLLFLCRAFRSWVCRV